MGGFVLLTIAAPPDNLAAVKYPAIAILFLLATTSCGMIRPAPTLDERVRLFNDAAFGFVPDGTFRSREGGQDETIAKWAEPIRISISGATDPEFVTEIRQTMDEIENLTAIPVVWFSAGSSHASLRIRLEPAQEFVINDGEPANCYAAIDDDVNGVIREAEIVIGMDADGRPFGCVAHELMHALGFRGHAYRLPTVLSTFAGQQSLTDWDRLMLRLLYDPRLAPGMPRREALPLVREILAAQGAGGTSGSE